MQPIPWWLIIATYHKPMARRSWRRRVQSFLDRHASGILATLAFALLSMAVTAALWGDL